MFKNHFITAMRNLLRSKAFSAINITGLSLGLACSLLIALWINDEYNVDAFHANGPQLYSIYERHNDNGNISAFFGTPGVMADEMRRVLPEVELAANCAWNELATFEANNKIIKEDGNHAGPDFFKMFSYRLLAGKAETALASPSDIAISKKMAGEFFGTPAQAIGKTLRYQNMEEFRVAAVFDDVPANSTAKFDYMLNWQHFLKGNSWAKDWTNNGPPCYIMLRKGTNAKAFEARIARFFGQL